MCWTGSGWQEKYLRVARETMVFNGELFLCRAILFRVALNRNIYYTEKMSFNDSSLPLAVVVAHTRWDEPPRMRHHVTQQLMRWFNVLFVEFFATGRGGSDHWRKEDDRLLIYSPKLAFTVPVRLYANEPLTHTVVNRCYVRKIKETITTLNAETVLLFNFSWCFPQILGDSLFNYKAYICCDEFPGMHSSSNNNPFKLYFQLRLFRYYENQVIKRADVCLTPHYPLRDRFLNFNDHVEILSHAHSYHLSDNLPVRKTDERINVAFAGYLNQRLITSWLKAVANQKDMTLHLIGPLDGLRISDVCELSSARHIPPVAEEELLELFCKMDVLIIPYDMELQSVSIMTTHSKTFQYIASTRPIVISHSDNYIKMPYGVFYEAVDADDFVHKIRQAYEEDCSEYQEVRMKIAKENTWDKRGEQLYATVKKALGDEIPGQGGC